MSASFDGVPEARGDAAGDRNRIRGRAVVAGLVLSRLLPEARFLGCDDLVATGVCDDPRHCRPGDVFVARLTAEGDGHDQVARALSRGAVGVVAERVVPTDGKPLCIVPSSGRAFARLAHAAAGDPARRLQVIAVTGTSGKTTTAWLIASVLAECGLRVGVLSDLGCLGADDAEPVAADIDRPEVLARWLRRLLDGGCTHAVVEVSSALLAADGLVGIACDTVVVTNMAVAHLDLHGSVSAYHAVKARILDALGRDGCLVGNADDDRVARLLERWPATEGDGMTITAGLRQPADVSATPVDRSLFGQTFLVTAGGHSMPVAVPVPVAGFVRDSLLAIAVGLRYRLPLERIGRGIEAAGSVSGRLERIDRGQEYAAFIDHPTSGHAVAATLAGLRRLTSGRLVVLAEAACAARLMKEGSGSSGSSRSPSADDGDGIDERFARRVSRWADECFVVPRTLLAEEGMAADIVAYARIDRLLHALEAGDCLVVLGHPGGGLGPVEPDGDPLSLAAVVEGWLQLAHVPEPGFRGRRAA